MLAKPQGFPRKLGGCAGLDPRLRSALSAGVGDGERGLRRGLRAPGVGVRPKWVLEYSPSNKRIRYFVSITYVRTGLWTAHKFCGGGLFSRLQRTTMLFKTRSGAVPMATRLAVPDRPVVRSFNIAQGPATANSRSSGPARFRQFAESRTRESDPRSVTARFTGFHANKSPSIWLHTFNVRVTETGSDEESTFPWPSESLEELASSDPNLSDCLFVGELGFGKLDRSAPANPRGVVDRDARNNMTEPDI